MRFENASFVRLGLGNPGMADLRSFSEKGRSSMLNFAVLTQLHRIDWSGEVRGRINAFEASQITELVCRSLNELKSTDTQTLHSKIEHELLSVCQTANTYAHELKIVASLLVAVWEDARVHVASIGGCQASLLRAQSLQPVVVGDYLRLEANGVLQTPTTFLTRALGTSTIREIRDVNFSTCNLEIGDIVLFNNKQLSKSQVLEAESRFAELQDFVSALGEKQLQGVDTLEAVLLHVLRAK